MPVKIKKPFYIIRLVFIKVCDIIFLNTNRAGNFAAEFLILTFFLIDLKLKYLDQLELINCFKNIFTKYLVVFFLLFIRVQYVDNKCIVDF